MIKKKSLEKKNGSSSRFSGLRQLLRSNATHFVLGLVIFVISIYVSIALFSFFFTGAADQSKIEGKSIFYLGSVEGIGNWTGLRGAILSEWLMNKGFGVSTFFILLFFIFVGLRLMKAKYVNLIRYFIICSMLTIWTSVTSSFFSGLFKGTIINIGGKHGTVLSEYIVKNFGVPGTILIIIVSLVIILMIISSHTIPFIQKLFGRKAKEKKEEPKEKPKEKKSFLKNIFKRKPKVKVPVDEPSKLRRAKRETKRKEIFLKKYFQTETESESFGGWAFKTVEIVTGR